MNAKFIGLVALVAAASLLLSVASCGRDQQLVSIAIQPAVETFGSSSTPVNQNQGLQVQLRALGSYIHPPVTKDITSQVTWASNTPQMFTVDSSGLLTATAQTCGATLVSATVNTNTSAGGLSSSGAIVTGYMTANIVCYTSSSVNPLLALSFIGSGSGTVVSTPPGLSCSGSCYSQAFPVGTPIILTASPNTGSTFGGWSTCPITTSTNVCSFTLAMDTVVTVAFN